MVYVAAKPLQSCRDVLWNAFRFYVGEAVGVIDCPPSGKAGGIRLRDLKVILSPLVRVETMSTVLTRFDDAWVNVASQSASSSAEIIMDAEHSAAAMLLRLSSFEHILEDPSIESMIEESIVVGRGAGHAAGREEPL